MSVQPVRILDVAIAPTARNGFADGVVRMTDAANTDAGYAALVEAVAPAILVAHRSFGQWDGTYNVTVTIRP